MFNVQHVTVYLWYISIQYLKNFKIFSLQPSNRKVKIYHSHGLHFVFYILRKINLRKSIYFQVSYTKLVVMMVTFCHFFCVHSHHGMLITEGNSDYNRVLSSGRYIHHVLWKLIVSFTLSRKCKKYMSLMMRKTYISLSIRWD